MITEDKRSAYLNRMRTRVQGWNPEHCRDIDIRIARDGTWYHEGSAIQRQRMTELFSSILRRETNGEYYLVTPAEKLRIQVEDVPFIAVDIQRESRAQQQILRFTTNVGETVVVDSTHGLRISLNQETQESLPYVMVRNGLEARLDRSTFYQLVQFGRERNGQLFVWSQGACYLLGDLKD